jgi:hypothetical protein
MFNYQGFTYDLNDDYYSVVFFDNVSDSDLYVLAKLYAKATGNPILNFTGELDELLAGKTPSEIMVISENSPSFDISEKYVYFDESNDELISYEDVIDFVNDAYIEYDFDMWLNDETHDLPDFS